MSILLGILYGVMLAALLVVLGIQPPTASHSRFELKRRLKAGDDEAKRVLARLDYWADLISLQRVVGAVLLVGLSVIGVSLFGWLIGATVSLVIAFVAGALAHVSFLRTHSQRLYDRHEVSIISFMRRHRFLFGAIRSISITPQDRRVVESKEELAAVIHASARVLTKDEKAAVEGALRFDERTVESIMTPRSSIESIGHDEVLGPLVLSDLHKTGHSRFPVIDGDIDHIVGMLSIQDLLVVGKQRQTQKVNQAMEKTVYYIRQDQTLDHALNGFLRTQHHLFVVVNSDRETVGLLSLEDVVEMLIGRTINDEFDVHDDLRVVAGQNPRHDNMPKTHQDG